MGDPLADLPDEEGRPSDEEEEVPRVFLLLLPLPAAFSVGAEPSSSRGTRAAPLEPERVLLARSALSGGAVQKSWNSYVSTSPQS